jgi:hypothetical protein|tara:strand:+ start:469 stop:591 length:123 start_codon:yes stop_codon:yes gene_type:complete
VVERELRLQLQGHQVGLVVEELIHVGLVDLEQLVREILEE